MVFRTNHFLRVSLAFVSGQFGIQSMGIDLTFTLGKVLEQRDSRPFIWLICFLCYHLPLCHIPRREVAPGWNGWNANFRGNDVKSLGVRPREDLLCLFVCIPLKNNNCDFYLAFCFFFLWVFNLQKKKKSPIWLKWVFPSDVDVGSLFWLWFFSLSFKAKQMPVEMSRSVSFGRGEADLWVWIDLSSKDFCHQEVFTGSWQTQII